MFALSRCRGSTRRSEGRVFSCRAALIILSLAAAPSQAPAATIDYFSSFGTVQNESYGTGAGSGGICAAVSYINGAAYLQTADSSVYGGTTLSTGSVGNAKSAAEAFAVNGWTSPSGTNYTGYYNRSGDSCENLWNTVIDWTESYAPGLTKYSGQCYASIYGSTLSSWEKSGSITNCFPTVSFLNAATTANDYVELGIFTYTLGDNNEWGHAINALEITQNKNGTDTIWYQDPNYPTEERSAVLSSQLFTDGEGDSGTALTFNILESGIYYPVYIAEAVALAPVPEPGTFVLTAVGSVLVFGFVRFRRKRSA